MIISIHSVEDFYILDKLCRAQVESDVRECLAALDGNISVEAGVPAQVEVHGEHVVHVGDHVSGVGGLGAVNHVLLGKDVGS